MEVWEGQYGLVARVLSPSFEHVARSMDRQGKEMDRVADRLETIIRTNETPLPAPANNKAAAH
jgi:hypothetical protein